MNDRSPRWRNPSRLWKIPVAAMLFVPIAAWADPPVEKQEDQSAFATGDGSVISSSAFTKMLKDALDTAYQDLEVVFSVCQSGEFVTRLKAGLGGMFSVMTSSDSSHDTSVDNTPGDKDIPQGPKKDIAGLHTDSHFYHGFLPQYVKKLQDGKNTVSNQDLFNTAKANDHEADENPQYGSSGAAADKFTVHGGKSSNHAVVVSGGGPNNQVVAGALVDALKGAGYTNAEITNLKGADNTKAKLEAALADLRTKLNAHPNEEKAFVYIGAHGSYEERTVAYEPGKVGTPGGGTVIGGGASTVPVLVDTPILIRDLQEHLPRAGGGFWLDDPDVQRGGSPYIAFSTQSESFAGSTAVTVNLDGDAIGTVAMGNAAGADYQLSIPDPVLDQLMPQILSDHALTLGFDTASPLDRFRLAVDEDNELLGFTPLDYGISVGALLSSEAALPEPSSLASASVGLSALMWRYRRTRRQRAA